MSKIPILLFLIFIFAPSIALAQTWHFSSHLDFIQAGTIFQSSLRSGSDRPVAGIIGYHFTTKELGRLNYLGFGLAWAGVNSTNSTPSYEDVAITIPVVNIRLNKKLKEERTFFFNLNYGYNIIHKEHGLYLGVAFGI